MGYYGAHITSELPQRFPTYCSYLLIKTCYRWFQTDTASGPPRPSYPRKPSGSFAPPLPACWTPAHRWDHLDNMDLAAELLDELIKFYQPSTSQVVWLLFDSLTVAVVFFKNGPLILSTFKRLNILTGTIWNHLEPSGTIWNHLEPSGTTYIIVIGCHRELAWKSLGAPDLPCPPLILQQWPRKILPRNIGQSAQQWKNQAFSGSETGIPMIDHHLNLATNSNIYSPCSIFCVYLIGISTIQWVYIYIYLYDITGRYYIILYHIILCYVILYYFIYLHIMYCMVFLTSTINYISHRLGCTYVPLVEQPLGDPGRSKSSKSHDDVRPHGLQGVWPRS